MAWEVYGIPYYNNSELTDTTVYQSLKFDRSAVLRAVRIWVIIYNDPTFTSLNLKLYSNNENAANPAPATLLETSANTWVKGDLHSLSYACKEIHFEFDYHTLRRDTWYHFVLNASGYSGAAADKHLAWRYSYPDPVYPENITLEKRALGRYPLTLYPIFAEFNQQ